MQHVTPARLRNVLAIALALGILASIWIHRAFQEDTTGGTRTAIYSSTGLAGGKPSDDVRVDAWIDDSRITEGATITFWIAIQNTTAKPVSNVAILAFRKPNFTVPRREQKCWGVPAGGDEVPLCTQAAVPTSPRLPLSLPSGAVATIEGHLRAGAEPGQYSLAAVVGWTDSQGARRRMPVSVGPVTVEHEAKKTVATLSKAAQNFLKDLGLPLVFLWLGYWIKKLEQRREQARQAADEQTTRIRGTWMEMLPKVHQNAEKYYMPLMAYANNAVSSFRKRKADHAFFFYLQYLARAKVMTDAIGGLYLKSRAGEDILSDIWLTLRDRADDRFTVPVREEMQVLAKDIGTYQAFLEAEFPPEITEKRTEFATVLAKFAGDAALLRLFRLILLYEMNLIYEFWYGEPETFPTDDIVAARAELDAAKDDLGSKYSSLQESLERYLKDVQVRQQAALNTRRQLDGSLPRA